MATHNMKMLGRTPSSGICNCHNELTVPRGTARRRDERQWQADADRELNNRAKAE